MDAQVAVIGVGSIGSMALWRLAAQGVDAIGFEQYAPGHDQAAAGGESRIFRSAYLEGPQYVPLLLRARELWRELERESGQQLLTLNGGLMIGSSDSGSMRNVLVSAERFDLPHEVLDTGEMGRRYPQHRMLPGEIGFLDEWAGVLRPEFAVLAAARSAQARGARLVTGERVSAVEPFEGGVRVRAGDRTYTVEQAVVTAGPWTARFAPALAAHVTPRKLVMTWYPALDVPAYQPDRFPIFIRESGAVHVFGIPTLDGGSVKVAPHTPYGDLADGDDLDRNVAPGDLDAINRAVADLMPGLVPTPVRVASYMDAYTTDGHALVGQLPGTDNVWLLGAFSGHGFKMATAFGQVAADLVTEGKSTLPIDHLDPSRYL
ncbi:MAG TPA: N-methyl-L-tryptophan oxidase [Pseudonocardia sp.]|jgi:sarcosine oxidase|nr:N-methyl-L-tryptophan oxidase [Pseudonocardia sp.]